MRLKLLLFLLFTLSGCVSTTDIVIIEDVTVVIIVQTGALERN